MIPPLKTKSLFISYRSSDAAKVDRLAHDLALLSHPDGTPHFRTWQDKHNLPPASPNWWDAIVDAITVCDLFMFNLSRASLQSEVCRAELDYAHKRNRAIITVVLEGEFFLNPASGKYDLLPDTWALVPDWLREQQFLFYHGPEICDGVLQAVALYERQWPRDLFAQRPLNPDSNAAHGSNHAVYDAACDYAQRLALSEAEKQFDTLVRRNDPDYDDTAAEWIRLLRLYAELIDIDERPNAGFLFNRKWAAYEALFPKDFIDGLFDPKGFAIRRAAVSLPPVKATPAVVLSPIRGSAASPRRRSVDLLPAPFGWLTIPAGTVTLTPDDHDRQHSYLNAETSFDVPAFSIARYPLTNAQFALFIAAGGYQDERWWSAVGLALRDSEQWTAPRGWHDSEQQQSDYPVVGVSWHEAIAYCAWLRDCTGEPITLATEPQWQRAAQGDDNRVFPWGSKWNASRCNHDVEFNGTTEGTTPVRQYEGKGDSPFGVIDMAGNVSEWCLTDYSSGDNSSDAPARGSYRIIRGGSYNGVDRNMFRCAYRLRQNADQGSAYVGFRLARA